MLIMDFRCLLCLMVLLQHSLSIPFDYESSDTNLNPEFSSFLQDDIPGEDPNMLALSPNGADPGATSETGLLNHSPSDNADWSFLPNDNDMIIGDSGAICPLGKKRDGESCGPQTPLPNTPLPNLQFPDLLGTFGITNDNGGSAAQSKDPSADANALTGTLTVRDPCLLQVTLLIHACCDGPPGTPNGIVYPLIEGCALGTCTHSVPFYSSVLPRNR